MAGAVAVAKLVVLVAFGILAHSPLVTLLVPLTVIDNNASKVEQTSFGSSLVCTLNLERSRNINLDMKWQMVFYGLVNKLSQAFLIFSSIQNLYQAPHLGPYSCMTRLTKDLLYWVRPGVNLIQHSHFRGSLKIT